MPPLVSSREESKVTIMANFFELLGFDSNDMADAMPEKIVQVHKTLMACCC